MAAKYSLVDLHAAARDGSIEFDEASALHKTTPFFDTLLEVHLFARDVVLSLREEDWRKSVELGRPHDGWYDVYEKILEAGICEKHGVSSQWYLKLRLIEGSFGDSVFFVSFHQPEHPFTANKSKRGGQS